MNTQAHSLYRFSWYDRVFFRVVVVVVVVDDVDVVDDYDDGDGDVFDDYDYDDDDDDDDDDDHGTFSSPQDVKTWFFSALAPMFAPKPPRGGGDARYCTGVLDKGKGTERNAPLTIINMCTYLYIYTYRLYIYIYICIHLFS